MVLNPQHADSADRLRVLHLEDDPRQAEQVHGALRAAGLDASILRTADRDGFERGLRDCPDLVLADYSLPAFDGVRALRLVQERCPEVPFIFVSSAPGEELAVEMLKAGAHDYVLADRLDRLAPAVRRARRQARQHAEHRRAQEALRRSEQFLRRVIESTSDCIKLLDLQGRLLSMSPAGLRMLEIDDAAPLIGQRWVDYWPTADRPAAQDALDAAAAGRAGQFVGCLTLPSGARMWLEAVATPMLDERGRPESLLVVSRNVTDRIRYEADLDRKARELARSNADLEDFAYIASHDLKEPLRGIAHFASFLLEDEAPRLGPGGVEKLQTIARLSKRMHHLLDSLLEYSRVGRTELAMAEHDLGEILAGVLEGLRERTAAEGVEVVVRPPLPRLRCDAVRVGVVLHNLITNAIKYNTSAAKRIEISAAPGRPAEVRIRDNGIGIEPRHFARIFKMFERLHPHDRYGGGTGSGLAIAHKIVERHGGRLWVESTPREGSTFCLTLEPQPGDVPRRPPVCSGTQSISLSDPFAAPPETALAPPAPAGG